MTAESERQPYLSIVIPTRNDNRGGDLHQRLRTNVLGLLHQVQKHGLDCEVILVEWNPIVTERGLSDLIPWPQHLPCPVRVITVPPEIHGRFPHSEKVSFHGALAFNTGIRRARGEFILTSTVDLLYSDALIRFLASKSLRKDRFYRIDRRDVRRDVLKVRTTEGQLAFCRNHVIDIHDKQPHPFPAKFNIPHLHIGAPGDFILLSRDLWSAIQGWPEFDTLGVGLDVLVCYAAHFQGARELVLPSTMHLYHIDHDSLWKSSKPSLEQAFYVRLNLKRFLPVQLRRALGRIFHRIFPVKPGYWESRGVTSLNVPGIEKMLAEMSSGTRRPVFNDATWGLVDEKFPEFRIDADLPEASVKASRPG